MVYSCTISTINDEEVTVKIGDIEITGFVNSGIAKLVGDEALVEVFLYDDLEISECMECESRIERKGETFSYALYGELDIDKLTLKSVIDFHIDEEELFDYAYLDGKGVKIETVRIDFQFI